MLSQCVYLTDRDGVLLRNEPVPPATDAKFWTLLRFTVKNRRTTGDSRPGKLVVLQQVPRAPTSAQNHGDVAATRRAGAFAQAVRVPQRNSARQVGCVRGFPLESLDMSPYCLEKSDDKDHLSYDLFAVSNHYGSMASVTIQLSPRAGRTKARCIRAGTRSTTV
ncbi:hypothetical protein GQ600_18161 [Phytophthora cactorum]|nr:hypothetical protein GQ600_18161 [Phytophthora cactorum]